MNSLDWDELHKILDDIKFPFPWSLGAVDIVDGSTSEDGYLFRLQYSEKYVVTGREALQTTRWWFVGREDTEDQVVQTALKAVLTSAEHRVREHFSYKGQHIFHPHWSVTQLVELMEKGERHFDDAGS